MPAIPEAITLLQEMLTCGRISESEFQVLSAATHNKDSDYMCVPGNVTLGVDRHELETVSRVFNTLELLERILVFVPPQDLLTKVTRTCKGAKHAIDTSLSLQRRLYRAPDRAVDRIKVMPFPLYGLMLDKAVTTISSPFDRGLFTSFDISFATYNRLKTCVLPQDVLLTQPPIHNVAVWIIAPESLCSEHENLASTTAASIMVEEVLQSIGRTIARMRAKEPFHGLWPLKVKVFHTSKKE